MVMLKNKTKSYIMYLGGFVIKLLRTLIILIVIYVVLFFIIEFLKSEGDFNYQIKGEIDFDIKESALFYNDKEDLYVFNVNGFKFSINHEFNKESNVIKDVKYFKNDNYECILPIYKNDLILNDLLCYNGSYTYYYNLIGQDKELDEFAKSYDYNRFIDNNKYTEIENINVYKDNLIEDHYIEFTNYKGIYNVSNNFNTTVYDVSLFDKDVYNQKLGVFINNLYVVADYNEEYSFNIFKVIDFQNLKTDDIISNYKISFDSYIQGVVDNKIYLFDKDSKIQYEIDVEKQVVNKVGDLIKFYNNGWETMTINQALEEKLFIIDENYEVDGYVKVDKLGEIYYLYEDGFNVYKMIDNNLIYLFKTDNIDNIFYVDNFIYFTDNNSIKYYNDKYGVKKVIDYKELQYNENIRLYVYTR